MKERRAACASLQSEIVLCLPVRYATAVKLARLRWRYRATMDLRGVHWRPRQRLGRGNVLQERNQRMWEKVRLRPLTPGLKAGLPFHLPTRCRERGKQKWVVSSVSS
jgi:hypothetical protein